MKYLLVVAASITLAMNVGGCTKPNPAVCCVSAEDCSSIGVGDSSRDCSIGLTCQDHSCVEPSCTTSADCSGVMPVCTNGTCVACDAQNACPMDGVCDVGTGACVACLTGADCVAATPICDQATNTCRGCQLDSECPSNACGDDGQCVAEANVVYADATTGSDGGECTLASPCQTLEAAIAKTSLSRAHVVLATDTYPAGNGILINSSKTTAPAMTIHGGNSTLSGGAEGILNINDVAVTMRDLIFVQGGSALQTGSAPVLAERITVQNGSIFPGTNLTVHDLDMTLSSNLTGIAIDGPSNLKLDRATIRGGLHAISNKFGNGGGAIDASNVLIFGTSDVAITLIGSVAFPTVTIRFSTIADSGLPNGAGSAGAECSGGVNFQSSIIWTASSARTPISAGCGLMNTIVGPAAVAGALNEDPSFVNEAGQDYHLAAGSPAIDAAASGPATDFEGDARPQGPRFDIGADELKQ